MEAYQAVGTSNTDTSTPVSSSPHSTATTTLSSSPALQRSSLPDILGQSLHAEAIYLSGWLWKQHHTGPHRSWRRKWVSCCVMAVVEAFLIVQEALSSSPLAVLPTARPPVLHGRHFLGAGGPIHPAGQGASQAAATWVQPARGSAACRHWARGHGRQHCACACLQCAVRTAYPHHGGCDIP
jgi:hypothetical protein